MAIAEIIYKKWVEPLLADNYNRGRVEGRIEGLAEGRLEGLAEGRVVGLVEGRVEGLAEGRVEGVADADQEWEAWLTRRDAAIAAGESFGELPPSRRRQAARRNGAQRLAWLPSQAPGRGLHG